MPPLRRQQFERLAERANENPGGFSINVNTGHEPKTGYMVSLPGAERKMSIPTTPEEHQEYTEKFAEPLHEPGNYYGFWHPKDRPTGVADVSARFPNRQRRRALKEMVMNKQEAAYDVNTGDDVPNVVHPANANVEGLSPADAAYRRQTMDMIQEHFVRHYRAQENRPSYQDEFRQLSAK